MKILIITDHYYPGFKAGGPIRSLTSMTDSLGDEFVFFVLTPDRDFNSRAPYPNIVTGAWQTVGKAQVMYITPTEKCLWRWRRLLTRLECDVIYLNSCFSKMTIKTLVLRSLKMIPSRPAILAPRGEFAPGALALKKTKKAIYLFLSRWTNIYKNIIWQASSENEQRDIHHVLGKHEIQIIVAPNLVPKQMKTYYDRREKETGYLRIVFLSRISRMKNLDYALQILSSLCGIIIFDIYGPIEDPAYWQECRSIITQFPTNILVTYRGEVIPEHAGEIFSKYHLFLFPTRGENFGHVISEALRAGCPVLISDQTPWQGLEEKKAGWDVPLSQPEQFVDILNTMTKMNDTGFQEWSQGARLCGEHAANNPSAVENNRVLFLTALKRK